MIVDTETGEALNDRDFRRKFPNTSFPNPIPDAAIADRGHARAVMAPEPDYDPITQRLVAEKTASEVNGEWVFGWTVIDLSEEEIAEKRESLRGQTYEAADAEYISRAYAATGVKLRGEDQVIRLIAVAVKETYRNGAVAKTMADLHDSLEALKDRIEAAATVDEIRAIDVTADEHWR